MAILPRTSSEILKRVILRSSAMQSNTFLHRSCSHGSQPIFAIAESGEVSLTTQTCFEIMLPVVEGVVDRDFPQAQFALKPQALQPASSAPWA